MFLLVKLVFTKLRWAITPTAITKRNTFNKENLTNKKVLLSYEKGLLSYKKGFTDAKNDLLTNAEASL